MLVETAYISNPAEERRLRQPAQQSRLADAIAAGVHTYLRTQSPRRHALQAGAPQHPGECRRHHRQRHTLTFPGARGAPERDGALYTCRHAHPCAARRTRRPDRRRRGHRASRLGRQGAGRERPRRRGHADRDRHRARRRRPDPGARRRPRYRRGRAAAGAGAPRDQQDRLARGSGGGHDPRFSRRGAAVDRLGGAAAHQLARRRRRAGRGDRRERWRARRRAARGPPARHHGRGARVVLQRAGAAQVREQRRHRARPHRAAGRAAGAVALRCGACACATAGACCSMHRRSPARTQRAAASRCGAGRGLSGGRGGHPPRRRAAAALRLGRPADALARAAGPAVLVRQRPCAARQAAHECRAPRLPRRAVPRPPRRLRAVPHPRSEARRRQRAPAEARGALPRQPPGARLRMRTVERALAGTRPSASAAAAAALPDAGGVARRPRRGGWPRGRHAARAGRVVPARQRDPWHLAAALAEPPPPESTADEPLGVALGAAARGVHPRPEPRRPGAGGHARRARARAVREAQGRARHRRPRLAAAARAPGHRAARARAGGAPRATCRVGAGRLRAGGAVADAPGAAQRAGHPRCTRAAAHRRRAGARAGARGGRRTTSTAPPIASSARSPAAAPSTPTAA